MATMEVNVPDIGDFDEVAVIELLVKVGDKVRAEQSLITVESDKASMEIPSSHAGVVKALSVKLGDKVKQGSVILVLETEGTNTEAKPVVSDAMPSSAAVPAVSVPAAVPDTSLVSPAPVLTTAPVMASDSTTSAGLPHASPSVRKFARE